MCKKLVLALAFFQLRRYNREKVVKSRVKCYHVVASGEFSTLSTEFSTSAAL